MVFNDFQSRTHELRKQPTRSDPNSNYNKKLSREDRRQHDDAEVIYHLCISFLFLVLKKSCIVGIVKLRLPFLSSIFRTYDDSCFFSSSSSYIASTRPGGGGPPPPRQSSA